MLSRMPRRGSLRLTLILAALIIFIVLPSTVDFLMSWLWFGSVAIATCFSPACALKRRSGRSCSRSRFFVLFGNLWIAVSSIASPYIVLGKGAGTVQRRWCGANNCGGSPASPASCVVMMGLVAGTEWLPWLQFWHAVPFGLSDPILGHDIGFYVFRLPMLEMADQFAMTLLIFSFIGSAAAYVLAGALNFTRRGGVSVAGKARLHLSLIAAAFFLALAYHAYLDIPQLLTTFGGPGTVHGASYADVMARLPALRVLVVVTIVAAGLAAYNAFARALWPLPLGLALYVITAVGGSMYAAAIQRFVVSRTNRWPRRPTWRTTSSPRAARSTWQMSSRTSCRATRS